MDISCAIDGDTVLKHGWDFCEFCKYFRPIIGKKGHCLRHSPIVSQCEGFINNRAWPFVDNDMTCGDLERHPTKWPRYCESAEDYWRSEERLGR